MARAYDGHDEAQNFELEQKNKLEEKAKREAKQKKIARDTALREKKKEKEGKRRIRDGRKFLPSFFLRRSTSKVKVLTLIYSMLYFTCKKEEERKNVRRI